MLQHRDLVGGDRARQSEPFGARAEPLTDDPAVLAQVVDRRVGACRRSLEDVRFSPGALRAVLDEVPDRRPGRLERREPQHPRSPCTHMRAGCAHRIPTDIPAGAPRTENTVPTTVTWQTMAAGSSPTVPKP